MSKINIDRIVKDIKSKTTSLTPIIEAICNSIDAIDSKRTDGTIDIIVKRNNNPSFDFDTVHLPDIDSIDIIDNGIGFTEENKDSFDTYRSGFKMSNGGKGFGRFMYLKYFNHVSIESIFCENGKYKKRCFTFGHADEIIENETIVDIEFNETIHTGTILHLTSIKDHDLDKGLDVIARKLVERLLAFFVTGGENTPKITIKEEGGSNPIVLNNYIGKDSAIQQVGKEEPITLKGRTKDWEFLVKTYKIYYSALTNKICLTANMREVTDSALHNYVPEFKETMFEITNGIQKNFMIKAYVQGTYLDENVTTERDGFNFGKEDDLYSDLSEKQIMKAVAQIVKNYFVADIEKRYNDKKQKVEHYVYNHAPWNKTLLKDVDMESIPIGISDFDLEMRFQKIKFDKEQTARIALKELQDKHSKNEEETEDALEDEINEILKNVTDTAKNDLAHYVCQRRKIIELFDDLRKRIDGGKSHKESELHNLIFPMIKDDRDVEYEEHNLWLLDERFNFTQYIASDKVISHSDHKEPDLAIFYESGLFYRNGDNSITSPIAIVEFKRPKRTNYTDEENPIIQALRYAGKILAGKYEMPEGLEDVIVDKNVTPVYIYIVCDIVPKIVEFAGFAGLSISPDKQGYFGYNRDYNAYIEIKSFKKVIDDAKMRNQIFFKKLGLL
ncbi:MAG: ATP-binding protein [Bacteroidetes bacterium]|uniref:ATP-binding protein n=1 Tax=Candidatus Cryptobacteroides excrementipullorum TaxID=2840761 RepID=A0A9D9NKZ8_9BACT|nr:ATP-binding protein [Candidatus Cryptobacteroides excrementipullorum]